MRSVGGAQEKNHFRAKKPFFSVYTGYYSGYPRVHYSYDYGILPLVFKSFFGAVRQRIFYIRENICAYGFCEVK